MTPEAAPTSKHTSPTGRGRRFLFGSVLLLLATLAASNAAGQPPRSASTLTPAVDSLLASEDLSNAFWGIHAVNLRTGETVVSHNAGHSFVPASNLKLYTTAAALDRLGPEFRYSTRLYLRGHVRGDTLYGDLIVRGAGDPSIGGRFTNGDRTRTFRQWADSIKAAGIRYITGDIIGDDNIFNDKALGTGWSWDDLTYYYAAQTSGLSFNDNCVDVFIRSRDVGEQAAVSWRPYNTDYVSIENHTVTLPSDSSLNEGYERRMDSNHIRLYSRVPAGRIDTESISIDNPTRYFLHVFRETLLKADLRVAGHTVDIDDRPEPIPYGNRTELRRLGTYTSPPLTDLVRVINKKSQNLYADQLFKTLGVHALPPESDRTPGTFNAGAGSVEEFLAGAGVDTSRVQMVDGSGLSRQNLVTPRATTQLLTRLWNHPDDRVREAFYASLPVGGIDGTLQYRFDSAPARGNVRAKTGFLSNVRSLSGYVRTGDDIPMAFTIFCNSYTADTDRVDDIQHEIVSRMIQTRFP